MRWRELVPLLKETFHDFGEDKVPRLAAALSYYTLFSLAPLVLIAMAIAGFCFGDQAGGGIERQIRDTVGPTAAQAIDQIVQASRKPSHGIAAAIVGVVTLLLGASGVFGQLKDALNTIWGVEPKPGRGFKGMLEDRFLSFTMVLGVGFLLMVSLVLSAALAAVSKFLGSALPVLAWLGPVLDVLLSVGVFTLLLALIYRVLPDARIAWHDVWVGAALTAVLFTLGKFLLGLYLGRSSVGSAYGAAGSLVVLLLWVYYSSQILFFGAEFTKVYARRFGARIVPEADAVAVTPAARAEQGIPRDEQRPETTGQPPDAPPATGDRWQPAAAPAPAAAAGPDPRMPAPSHPAAPEEEATLSALLVELKAEVGALASQELALAKAELGEKAARAGKEAAAMAAGGALAAAGFLALIGGVVVLLTRVGMPAWAAALMVGVTLAGLGVCLAWTGLLQLRGEDLKPRATLASLRSLFEPARRRSRAG